MNKSRLEMQEVGDLHSQVAQTKSSKPDDASVSGARSQKKQITNVLCVGGMEYSVFSVNYSKTSQSWSSVSYQNM